MSPHFLSGINATVYPLGSLDIDTALHGGLVMAKNGRPELRDNIYEHYRSIFNHCDVTSQQISNRIRWKKRK